MSECDILDSLRQLGSREAGQTFRAVIRPEVCGLIIENIADEATELCGSAYHPRADSACRRGCSAFGSVLLDRQRVKVRRPRVVRDNTRARREERRRPTRRVAMATGFGRKHPAGVVRGHPVAEPGGSAPGFRVIAERGVEATVWARISRLKRWLAYGLVEA